MTLPSVESKEMENLKKKLKKDFKYLFETKTKLENDNTRIKKIIEEAKIEDQKLNKESEEKTKHIDYDREYVESLTNQTEESNSRMQEVENQNYCYLEPVKKGPKYVVRQELEEEESEDDGGSTIT